MKASRLGPRQAGVIALPQRIIAQLRAELAQSRPVGRPRKDKPTPGLPVHQRCLLEARNATRAKGIAWHPASSYGTPNHSMRHRWDRAVQAEFIRLLQANGVHVEGA